MVNDIVMMCGDRWGLRLWGARHNVVRSGLTMFTPDTDVPLGVNYTQNIFLKKSERKQCSPVMAAMYAMGDGLPSWVVGSLCRKGRKQKACVRKTVQERDSEDRCPQRSTPPPGCWFAMTLPVHRRPGCRARPLLLCFPALVNAGVTWA